MVKFPNKRVFGLIGAPRSGKSEVGQYLQESRDFTPMAFADKIKEEYGISKEDFETAKITGEIEKLRKELWDFSAERKKDDPEYFIRLVMEETVKTERSIVITDIRTEDEFNALFKYLPANIIKRVYMVRKSAETWEKINEGYPGEYKIKDSKISKDFFYRQIIKHRIRRIDNDINGLYKFHLYLNNFFFKEDIMDLVGPSGDLLDPDPDRQVYYNKIWREIVSDYISQFDIIERI
jgi:hypothetical protein